MTARYVNEHGIVLHDAFRNKPAPDLRLIDGSELKKLPVPEVIEIVPREQWLPERQRETEAKHRAAVERNAKWAERAFVAIVVVMALLGDDTGSIGDTSVGQTSQSVAPQYAPLRQSTRLPAPPLQSGTGAPALRPGL